ncbi:MULTISPECIES: hypothetical protein [unclassified Streptomyces]|uniref:hypothetical protein n=1 Tax=unclassified Streptomyces TaxID=2593676 RepID=UPI002E339FC1|nr:hypothetical protein [Streptomyces sp. NBC_01716]
MRRTRSGGRRGRACAGRVAAVLAVAATVVALVLSAQNAPACDRPPAATRAGSSC